MPENELTNAEKARKVLEWCGWSDLQFHLEDDLNAWFREGGLLLRLLKKHIPYEITEEYVLLYIGDSDDENIVVTLDDSIPLVDATCAALLDATVQVIERLKADNA